MELKASNGVLLYDSAYPSFVKRLLDEAQKEVLLTMFYMRFVPKQRTFPVNPLVRALVEAHRRGVKVSVFVDHDNPEDVYLSRVVNKPAVDFLRKAGVPVRWRGDGTVTHSKVLLVDGEHVVLGSHNWTASAFRTYKETSLYLRSRELTRHYRAEFARRFLL